MNTTPVRLEPLILSADGRDMLMAFLKLAMESPAVNLDGKATALQFCHQLASLRPVEPAPEQAPEPEPEPKPAAAPGSAPEPEPPPASKPRAPRPRATKTGGRRTAKR